MTEMRDKVQRILKRTPILWRIANRFNARFPGVQDYWEGRYAAGGDSGVGSYGALAEFKAEVINDFVSENGIRSAIEFGCGDGNQLGYLRIPQYVGWDVSPSAVKRCIATFADDPGKSFFLYDPDCFLDNTGIFSADLGLSLDVLYHLVDDKIYFSYLRNLFAAANRFVMIYSSDFDETIPNSHVRHRKFSTDVGKKFPEWRLRDIVRNRFPMDRFGPEHGSNADFFVYEKKDTI